MRPASLELNSGNCLGVDNGLRPLHCGVDFLVPPWGSPFKSVTNSVPLPVSELNISSVNIRLPGKIAARSSAQYDRACRGNGDPVNCFLRAVRVGRHGSASPRLSPTLGLWRTSRCGLARSATNETTFHRMFGSPLRCSKAVKTCVPSGRSAPWIVTGCREFVQRPAVVKVPDPAAGEDRYWLEVACRLAGLHVRSCTRRFGRDCSFAR